MKGRMGAVRCLNESEAKGDELNNCPPFPVNPMPAMLLIDKSF